MATVIVSNLAVFPDATGHGNQSHLVYAANQDRWWLFVIKTKTSTTVSCYVSSSDDLQTAAWSASTDSPVFPNSRAMSTNDQRNLGVCSITNGTTDVAHLSVGIGTNVTSVGYTEHIWCTFTGASSITWGSWAETVTGSSNAGGWELVKGNTLGVSTTSKFIHESSLAIETGQDANARKSTNADSGSTWTSGFAANVVIDSSIVNTVNAYALAPLASDVMLCVYENGGAANPNCTDLRYTKSGATGTWTAGTGTGAVSMGGSTQDLNDWCICTVDTTHIYAFRVGGTGGSIVGRVYNGSLWVDKLPPSMGALVHKAGSGLFAATDGTDLYLFFLDSTGAVYYVKGSTANGTISYGAWTLLESAGTTARNYISGFPAVGNSQIGVIWTAVNGTNFDIVVSALSIAVAPLAGSVIPFSLGGPPRLGTPWAQLPFATPFISSQAAGNNWSVTAEDSPVTDDSAARLFSGSRSFNETPSTTETVTRILTAGRSAIDNPTTSDNISRVLSSPRLANDTPSTTDNISRLIVGIRSLGDSPSTTDTTNRIVSLPRNLNDSPNTADSTSRSISVTRTNSDTPSTSESLLRNIIVGRSLSDTPSILSTVSQLWVGSRTLVDSPNTAEIISRAWVGTRTLGDTPSTAESVSGIKGRVVSLTDVPHTSDTVSRLWVGSRAAIDSPSSTDSPSRRLAAPRSLADTPSTTDSVSRTWVATRNISDSLSTLDTVSRRWIGSRILSDNPATTEIVSRLWTGLRTISDSSSTTDTVTKSGGLAFTLADSPLSTDSTALTIVRSRQLTDAPSTVDSVSRLFVGSRTLTDSVLGLDSILAVVRANVTLTPTPMVGGGYSPTVIVTGLNTLIASMSGKVGSDVMKGSGGGG